jgi:hypothetical protein
VSDEEERELCKVAFFLSVWPHEGTDWDFGGEPKTRALRSDRFSAESRSCRQFPFVQSVRHKSRPKFRQATRSSTLHTCFVDHFPEARFDFIPFLSAVLGDWI